MVSDSSSISHPDISAIVIYVHISKVSFVNMFYEWREYNFFCLHQNWQLIKISKRNYTITYVHNLSVGYIISSK